MTKVPSDTENIDNYFEDTTQSEIFSNNYFNGGRLWYRAYKQEYGSRIVTSYENGKFILDSTIKKSGKKPKTDTGFYVEGKEQFLDDANEWVQVGNKIYLK